MDNSIFMKHGVCVCVWGVRVWGVRVWGLRVWGVRVWCVYTVMLFDLVDLLVYKDTCFAVPSHCAIC